MATPEGKATKVVVDRTIDWKCRTFRNNSGGFYDKTGRFVSFGLGAGNEAGCKDFMKTYKTGDRVGWTPVTITPEMVGKTIAVFTNIEIKAFGFNEKLHYNKNTREYGQNNFNNLVINQGGIAGFASCAVDVDRMIQNFYTRVMK